MAEKLVTGGTTTWHDFLKIGGGLAGERFYVVGGATTWKYFVLDHLGSVAVMTDSAGSVAERLSYDAWGRRRNANGTDDATCSITSATTRGYTGHEMMDTICEINANARIYDPTIGRFMTPDSIIPNPFDGQAFNRYSYVSNGPLSATDPSGHMYSNGRGCFGCFGPGLTTTQDGTITSAASQAFTGLVFGGARVRESQLGFVNLVRSFLDAARDNPDSVTLDDGPNGTLVASWMGSSSGNSGAGQTGEFASFDVDADGNPINPSNSIRSTVYYPGTNGGYATDAQMGPAFGPGTQLAENTYRGGGGGNRSPTACIQGRNDCERRAERLFDRGYENRSFLLRQQCYIRAIDCVQTDQQVQQSNGLLSGETYFPPAFYGGVVIHRPGMPPVYQPGLSGDPFWWDYYGDDGRKGK